MKKPRKLSTARIEQLRKEKGTRVLTKAKLEAKEAAASLEQAPHVPETKVAELLNAHESLMSEVESMRKVIDMRTWKDMRFAVKRRRTGQADKLEVTSASGARAVFHVERDEDGFISGASVDRANPGISLNLKVIRDANSVMKTVETV